MSDAPVPLGNKRLLAVIAAQTEIAGLGHDLAAVMERFAQQALALTQADRCLVELHPGSPGSRQACAGRVNAGPRRTLLVPLVHLGQRLGLLKLTPAANRPFSATDHRTVTLLADAVAAALFHAGRHSADDLYHRATHDGLTELANRALFLDRLGACLAQSERDGQTGALLIVDMDGLKSINDRLGHRAGDAALVELARRLGLGARGSDTVARLGGDEFGLLLRPIEHEEGLLAALQRIRSSISAPFTHCDQTLPLSASIGCALFPAESHTGDELMHLADLRMYADKRQRQARMEPALSALRA